MKIFLIITAFISAITITVIALKYQKNELKSTFNIPGLKMYGGTPCHFSDNHMFTSMDNEATFTGPTPTQVSQSIVKRLGTPTRAVATQANQNASYNPYILPTPGAKMISVNTDLGNPAIAAMQGSSRTLYDSLPLNAAAFNIRFFDAVQTRIFPFTNINQNRLPPGESMVIQRLYFYVMIAAAPPVVTSTAPLSAVAATAGLYAGNFSINIGQSEVVKKQAMTSMQSQFNKRAAFLNNDIMEMDNYLIIPPQIEFTVDTQLPNYTLVASSFLVLVLEGLGSLLNPKTNF